MKSPNRQKYNFVIGLIALFLPFVATLLMIGVNAQRLAHIEYRFSIEGYDPRDLLRGHYLIFRYKWPAGSTASGCLSALEPCCACISGEQNNPSVLFSDCETLKQNKMCKGVIEVGASSRGDLQPSESLRQYYIPEAQASKLETMLRNNTNHFEVGLVPQPGGGGKLKMLYIDGKALPQFLLELDSVP